MEFLIFRLIKKRELLMKIQELNLLAKVVHIYFLLKFHKKLINKIINVKN